MAKMDILRRANQQARRLKAAGVQNDALSQFLADKETFKANLSGKELSKALRAAAKKFVAKPTSTITGIKAAWTKGVKSGRISAKAAATIGGDTAKMAKYLNYGAESRRWMEAKALGMASDQIKFLNDSLKFSELSPKQQKEKFYKIMGEITDRLYKNNGASADEITDLILTRTEKYTAAAWGY